MNDKKFSCIKLLKLKDRRGDQIIQTFMKIGSPQKLGLPSVNFLKFQDSKKSTPESSKMH